LRAALRIEEAVPVVSCDVRVRRAATAVVTNLVEYALATRHRPAGLSTVDDSYPSKENE
jgi:hypothetical protein